MDIIYFCPVYFLVKVISIVETILDLLSPSRGGISAVQKAILPTFGSLMKRFLVISATSTAVVMAWPLAFNVILLISCREACNDCQNITHWGFVSYENNICVFSHLFLLLFICFV